MNDAGALCKRSSLIPAPPVHAYCDGCRSDLIQKDRGSGEAPQPL